MLTGRLNHLSVPQIKNKMLENLQIRLAAYFVFLRSVPMSQKSQGKKKSEEEFITLLIFTNNC